MGVVLQPKKPPQLRPRGNRHPPPGPQELRYWRDQIHIRAKNFAQRHRLDGDDCTSAANWGLAKAIASFQPQRGKPFFALASQAIQNAMIDFLRKKIRYDQRVKNYHDFSPEENLKVEFQDPTPSFEARVKQLGVTFVEQSLLRLHYGLSMTFQEMAHFFGMSMGTLKSMHHHILKRARTELEVGEK